MSTYEERAAFKADIDARMAVASSIDELADLMAAVRTGPLYEESGHILADELLVLAVKLLGGASATRLIEEYEGVFKWFA